MKSQTTNKLLRAVLIILLSFSFSFGLHAQTPINNTDSSKLYFSFDEFKQLAEKLSKRVNLFKLAWEADPKAEIFGGTTRDFLYWLKGQLRNVTSEEEKQKTIEFLESRNEIDIREFVIGDSDVDIVSQNALPLSPSTFGIKKIDHIQMDRFNPKLPMGYNEIHQGYIPVEKIRLGANGFFTWEGMVDGIKEIYRSQPTVHFANSEEFKKTYYAQNGLNHPILLAVRYIRIIAMNYYYTVGRAYPNNDLIEQIDPPSAKAVQEVISSELQNMEIRTYLRNSKFKEWLNLSIQKAFRSYTNPTATLRLFQYFHLDEFVSSYAGEIEPINQYLFAKFRNEDLIKQHIDQYGSSPQKLYSDPKSLFSKLQIYHGTRTEWAFQAILRQGILPSIDGSAGPGLYAVSERSLSFASLWGGSPDRVVRFDIDPEAKIIDLTQGEGARLAALYRGSLDDFADFFGADIVRYPYRVDAYVVKNSSVLKRPQGLTRQILSFPQLMERAQNIFTLEDLSRFFEILELNNFRDNEFISAVNTIPFLNSNDPTTIFIRRLISQTDIPIKLRSSALKISILTHQASLLQSSTFSFEKLKQKRRVTKNLSDEIDQFIFQVIEYFYPKQNNQQRSILSPQELKIHQFLNEFKSLLNSDTFRFSNKFIRHQLKKKSSKMASIKNKTSGTILVINPMVLGTNLFLMTPVIATLIARPKAEIPGSIIALDLMMSVAWTLLGLKDSRRAHDYHFKVMPKFYEIARNLFNDLRADADRSQCKTQLEEIRPQN